MQIGMARRIQQLFPGPRRNMESATAVETISADGEVVPAFLILKGKQHQSWSYQVKELRLKARIAVSESGYTNNELSMQWIRHFEDHTRGSKRVLPRWGIVKILIFGCLL